jgi:hypothetical protein
MTERGSICRCRIPHTTLRLRRVEETDVEAERKMQRRKNNTYGVCRRGDDEKREKRGKRQRSEKWSILEKRKKNKQ